MTITNVNKIITERSRPDLDSGNFATGPRIYPAPDFPFQGFKPADPSGWVQSAATPTESAIVIDNGMLDAVFR